MTRKMKKSIEGLICAGICMLVLLTSSVSCINTFAAGGAMLSIGSGYGCVGDSINISIRLENPKGISGIQFTIKYDYSALSVSEAAISKGSALDDWLFDKNVLSSKGEIKIACAGRSKLPETSPVNLCNIVFTIKAAAALGETPVSLEAVYAGNGTEKLDIASVNGVINVLSTPSKAVSPTPSAISQTARPTPEPISPTGNLSVTSLPDQKIVPAVKSTEAIERPESNLPTAFKYADIEGHWAAQNILKLIDSGLVSGYPDGTIKPDNKITRAEMVTILIKALGVDTGNNTNTGFLDNGDIPRWALKYVCYATKNSIVNGYEDNTFKPDSYINRSEMAVITIKAFHLSTDKENALNFSDIKSIPAWAGEFVSAAFRHNILKGYADNTIRPLNSITRAEAFVMLERAIEAGTR